MCGRYAAATSEADWVEEFEVERSPERWLPADYNVCPGKDVLIISGVPAEMSFARWGLVPSWAKDPDSGSRLANARTETVADKPSYRAAFARRRCLIPADGYYEWYSPATGRKQPFYIHRADGRPLAIAGLFETWHAGEADELRTCTLLTMAAAPNLERIHDRMPVLIAREHWQEWLDPTVPGKDLDPRILQARVEMTAYPVSAAVGSVRNNGPRLIEEIPAQCDVNCATSPAQDGEPTLF